MRLIDADALERDGWRMSRIVQIDEKTMEAQTRKPTDFPAVEPQPEPCEDTISRQSAIQAAECIVDHHAITPYQTMRSAMDHLQRILRGMPSAQPEQQWIPCSERMPDANGMYLVTMMEKAKAEDLGFDLDEIEVRKMRYSCNVGWQMPRHIPKWIDDVITDEVIAWMPLPEPYGEGGQ